MSFAKIAVTVDIIVGTQRGDSVMVLLVQRAHDPFAGAWALPGGFVEQDEDLPAAARRELEEETGLRLPESAPLLQFRTYGAPGRDPRGRTVTVVHTVYLEDAPEVAGADDAADARYWPLDALPPLAFDHGRVIEDFVGTLNALRTGSE